MNTISLELHNQLLLCTLLHYVCECSRQGNEIKKKCSSLLPLPYQPPHATCTVWTVNDVPIVSNFTDKNRANDYKSNSNLTIQVVQYGPSMMSTVKRPPLGVFFGSFQGVFLLLTSLMVHTVPPGWSSLNKIWCYRLYFYL